MRYLISAFISACFAVATAGGSYAVRYEYAGGWGRPNPPEMVGVQISPDPNDVVQVPWGRMEVPGVSGFIQCGMYLKDNLRPVFLITGQVKRKHEKEISKLGLDR